MANKVLARRFPSDCVYQDVFGNRFEAKAGDWEVSDSAGKVKIVTDEEFRSKYRSIGCCGQYETNEE